jgi:hypothetical protein
MEERIISYIDSLLSEGNGYISESTRNLVFKMSLRLKAFRKKEEFDAMVEQRISLFNEKENCPNCGVEQSKRLQVCDSCGYVMPGAHTSAISVQTLVENIETAIETVNSIPKPTLFSLFKEQYRVIFPYLTVWSFVMITIIQINYDEESMYIFVILFAFLSLVSFIYKKTKDRINRKELLQGFMLNYEKTKTLAKRHFGNEQSVRDLLKSYEGKINGIINLKKKIRTHLVIIYSILFLVTGYLLSTIPWYSREERAYEIRQEQELVWKKRNDSLMIENTKRLKPYLEKSFNLSLQNNSIYGPMANFVKIKDKSVKIGYIQENIWYLGSEAVGYGLKVDSVLVEVTSKLPKDKAFVLELCAFDTDSKPAFYNTILRCDTTDGFKRMIKEGKGKYYLSFKSEVLPFESEKTISMAIKDMELYEQAVSFNLVSRVE